LLAAAGSPAPRGLLALPAGGADVMRGQVTKIISDNGGLLVAVELSDGGRIPADTVLIGPRFKARVEPFDALGLHTIEHPSGLGDYVETDANGATNVPGLYAARPPVVVVSRRSCSDVNPISRSRSSPTMLIRPWRLRP